MAIASGLASGFDVVVVRDAASVVVRLQGHLDVATSPRLALVLASLLGDGCSAVMVDLAELVSLDAGGAWLIGEASRLFGDRDGELVVRFPSKPVRRVLATAGLAWLTETEHQAVDTPLAG